jgi:hypothetical protein
MAQADPARSALVNRMRAAALIAQPGYGTDADRTTSSSNWPTAISCVAPGASFWTNLAAAYTGLSQTMRGFVDGLRGVHKYVPRENPARS